MSTTPTEATAVRNVLVSTISPEVSFFRPHRKLLDLNGCSCWISTQSEISLVATAFLAGLADIGPLVLAQLSPTFARVM